eukprot:1142085-Pelagomonas_calceolata.AAC.1
MLIEKWTLPFFKKAGLQPATASTAARTDIECPCCQICNCPGGYEPINSEPPYLDMYICDVCQQTHWRCMKNHWKCMKELGCYTDEQKQEIDAADTWACPACAGLKNAQKIDRGCQSREELTKVTWIPPGSLPVRKLKRHGLNSNSVCLNLKPSRANLMYPDPQQTLPFLTLKDKALKSLMILALGGRNLTQKYAIKLPLTCTPPAHK